jgi:hypothetical protein
MKMLMTVLLLLFPMKIYPQIEPSAQAANTWKFQYRKAELGDVTHPYENGFVWDYKNEIGIVFGGHLGVTHNQHEDIIPEINNTNMTYIFSFNDNRFSKVHPMERPPKRCGVKLVYDEGWGHTLIFCGMYHNYFNGYLEPSLRFDGLVTEAPEYEMDYPLSPWAFNGKTRQWLAMRPLAVEGLPKGKGYFHGFGTQLAFAKEYGLALFCPTNYNRVYAYSPYFNQWTLLPLNPANTEFPPQSSAIPTVYDLKQRKLLYVYPGSFTWAYDVGTKSWSRLSGAGNTGPGGGGWNKPYLCAAFDSKNGVTVYLTADGSATWALPSGNGKWTRLNPVGMPASGGSYGQGLAYDPVRNVSIVFSAKNDEVWTFKYGNGIAGRPDPVENVSAVTSESGITLSWAAPVANTVPDMYYIHRCEWEDNKTLSSGIVPGSYAIVDSVSKPGWTDTDVAVLKKVGVFHSYYVSARSAQGLESDPSDPVFTVPRVPMGLTATPLSANQVLLRWKPKAESDIAGYNVYRAKYFYPKHNHMKAGKLNNTLIIGTPVYTDEAITLYPTTGTYVDTYFYKPPDMGMQDSIVMYVVTAVNRLGKESGFSPYALTHPDWVNNMWVDTTKKIIHWSPPRNGHIDRYQIYRGNMLAWAYDNYGHLVHADNTADTLWSYAGQNQVSCYRVRAVNSIGQVGFMSDVMAVQTKDDDQFGMLRLDFQDRQPIRDAFYDDLPVIAIEKPVDSKTGAISPVRAYPNPFNPAVVISVANGMGVQLNAPTLAIYNIHGRLVYSGQIKTNNHFTWHGKNQCGLPVSAGIYFCRLKIANKILQKRLILYK